jgi:hypothetical protein
MTYRHRMEAIKQRILEIVLDQRSVADETIAMQVADELGGTDIAVHTKRLQKQGLITLPPLASGRWQITDAGRNALESR